LTYDDLFRIIAVTDAIGQVTTLDYGVGDDVYKVSRVTDPFGRSASFGYAEVTTAWTYTNHNTCPFPSIDQVPTKEVWLARITDVIGLSSQFGYQLVTNPLPVSCAVCETNPFTMRCVSNSYSVNFIESLVTPYGTTSFALEEHGTTRAVTTTYPDGSGERVE